MLNILVRPTALLTGRSGIRYGGTLLPLDAVLPPIPALYALGWRDPLASFRVCYVATTENARTGLSGHDMIEPARLCGADRIWLCETPAGKAFGHAAERDLIDAHRPWLNRR